MSDIVKPKAHGIMIDMLMLDVHREDYDERESAKKSMSVADLIEFLQTECEPHEKIVFNYASMFSPLTEDIISHYSRISREEEDD